MNFIGLIYFTQKLENFPNFRTVNKYNLTQFRTYGDDFMKIKIALALTSVVFLTMWIILAFNKPFGIVILLSIISLFGSLLFLLEAKDAQYRWHLAAPLCISLSLLSMLTLLIYMGGLPGSMFTLGKLWFISLALLPLSSALVFLSLKNRSGSIDPYVVISYAVSILSVFALFLAYREIPKKSIFSLITAWDISKWSTIIGAAQFPFSVYWTYLLPIIGICFLVKAITYKDPGNILSPETVKSTQNHL